MQELIQTVDHTIRGKMAYNLGNMFDTSTPKRKREKTNVTTGGSELGEGYGTTGLDFMWERMGHAPRYEGASPFASTPNWFQQQQANTLNNITGEYAGEGGYFDTAKGMYGDVGAMSPEEVAAMSRSGGPGSGYFDPYRDKMKGYMQEDYGDALSMMRNKVGAGASGANAFGGTRQGTAEGVGGAKAMDDYLRAATAMDSQAFENAMQWQREDYQDDISRVKYANEANMGFGDMRTRAATSMRDITQPLSLITEQTAAGDKLRGYDAASDMWDQEQYEKGQSWKTDRLNEYMQGVSGGAWPQTTTQTQTGGQTQGEKNMGYAAIFFAKVMSKCIPEGTLIDTPDGPVAIEDIKVGAKVDSYYGTAAEVSQVHQYKEDPKSVRFYHIKFDNGGAVDCCDMHRVFGKRAKDCSVGDIINAHKITSITRYNGVERSYDLLTESIGHPVTTTGYRINNIPVNSMIEELAELAVELKQAA